MLSKGSDDSVSEDVYCPVHGLLTTVITKQIRDDRNGDPSEHSVRVSYCPFCKAFYSLDTVKLIQLPNGIWIRHGVNGEKHEQLKKERKRKHIASKPIVVTEETKQVNALGDNRPENRHAIRIPQRNRSINDDFPLVSLSAHPYQSGNVQQNVEYYDANDSIKDDGILYVHQGMIICQRKKHPIIPVQAIMNTIRAGGIVMNADYCQLCHKCFISQITYEEYKAQYGFMPIHFMKVKKNGEYPRMNEQHVIMDDESPLMMCGYNVSKATGLTDWERQTILQSIIDNQILRKPEIIRYLEQFIAINGSKSGMADATDKWKRDLIFIRGYQLKNQAKKSIYRISKWIPTRMK